MTDFTHEPSDSLGIAESEIEDIGLVKSDSISISEALAKNATKPLADSVTFADSEIEAPAKILTDSLSISEDRLFFVGYDRC